nr:exodeoxyribonuclease V subunit gamma [Burkholderiaceae bacterium]
MALSLFFDHRAERLADALCERVSRPSAGHPLARHSVVVPSIGVGRWLQQQVALRTGVCALLEPVFAGRMLWSSLRELMPGLPARSPFDPPTVRWRLLAIFDDLPDDAAELGPLRERLARATLAQQLAIADELAGLF